MRIQFQSPALLLVAILLLSLAATGATVYIAASQPALDRAITSRAGALPLIVEGDAERLVTGIAAPDLAGRQEIIDQNRLSAQLAREPGAGLLLEPEDFVEDPDMLPSYAANDRFYARQGVIRRLLDRDTVLLARPADSGFSGGIVLEPAQVLSARGIGALAAPFWIQIGSGLVVIVVAAVFIALRPKSFAVLSFAFAGLGITGAAYTAAIYSSRQFGMDPGLMLGLSELNHVFTVSFGVGMIALFTVYPARICAPTWTVLPAAAISYGSLVAYRNRLLPHDVVMLQNIVALLLLAILAMVFLQYRATRGRPADRAALVWLGMSVVVGATTFVALVILPVALGRPGFVTQAFGFILLAMIYVGIAFAVSRYRLFDIGRWSYRILIYAGMIVSLLALDVAFVLGLQMSEQASLAIASAIMLAVYFPLRDLVQERFVPTARQNLPELYRQAVASAYKFTPQARQAAWRRLMEDAFQPGHVEQPDAVPQAVAVRSEGIEIALPGYPWSEPLALGFAAQGRRLFGTQDVKLVEELAEIAASAHADRLSYEKGAEEERQRIARDLHDDVGATLLSGLHAVDEGRRQETLVEALSDIRRIAHDLSGQEQSMEQLVAQLRHDMRQRANAQARGFEWPLGSADDDDTVLPYRFHQHLSAAVREAVSNALKHGTGTIRVIAEIENGTLLVGISNEVSEAASPDRHGIGLKNIASRAAELGGHAEATSGAGRFDVSMSLPLPHARPQPGDAG
ncbi:sensor histidine kinase [Rhizobium sp.]